MEAMEALSEGRQIFDESKHAIVSYVAAWRITQEAKAKGGPKRPFSELLQNKGGPAAFRLALSAIDTHDLNGAYVTDAFDLLIYAISERFPELIEDMWSSDRVRGLIAADRLASRDEDTPAPLFWAIRQKVDAETFETLLEWPGLDLVLKGPGGTHALLSASESGNVVFVDLLLQRGVSPHNENTKALLSAVRNRHKDVVHRLLKGTNDTGTTQGFLVRALHSAIGWDNAIIKLLLKHGADPNGRGEDDRTALHVAVLAGDATAVEELLRHGAQVDRQDKNGAYPLLMAIRLGHLGILKLFIPNTSQAMIGRLLSQAVAAGHKAIIDLLLANRAPSKDEMDVTNDQILPLITAAENGREDIIKTLLEGGANPNALTSDQSNSPVFAAIKAGNNQIISAILDPRYNADVNLKVSTGHTALVLVVDLG